MAIRANPSERREVLTSVVGDGVDYFHPCFKICMIEPTVELRSKATKETNPNRNTFAWPQIILKISTRRPTLLLVHVAVRRCI